MIRRLMTCAVGLATCALALTAGAGAAAAGGARQDVQAIFTTQTAGISTGRVENGDFTDPDDPGGKPHSASRVVLDLAAGARWNTDAAARCGASDAELMLAGPDACPSDSRVGQGPVVVDTGVDGPGRLLNLDFTAFNARDALILLGRERQSGGYLVVRGTVHGGRLQIDFPFAPGTLPEGGALKTERIAFFERSGAEGAYLTTPPSCPAVGYWTNRLTYTYRDGVTQSVDSRSPCTRDRDTESPRIHVRGIPKSCARSSFVARVSVHDASGIRRVRAFVDHERVASTARSQFEVRVGVARLGPGRHRLEIRAVDRSGNAARRTVRFRRCASGDEPPDLD